MPLQTPFNPYEYYSDNDPTVDRTQVAIPGAGGPPPSLGTDIYRQTDPAKDPTVVTKAQTNYLPGAPLAAPTMGENGFLVPFQNSAYAAPIASMPQPTPNAPAPVAGGGRTATMGGIAGRIASGSTSGMAPRPGAPPPVTDNPGGLQSGTGAVFPQSLGAMGAQSVPRNPSSGLATTQQSLTLPGGANLPINPRAPTGGVATTQQGLSFDGGASQPPRLPTAIGGALGFDFGPTAPRPGTVPRTGTNPRPEPNYNNAGGVTDYVGRENAVDNHDYIFGRDPNYPLALSTSFGQQGQQQQDQLQGLGLASQNLGMSGGFDLYQQGQAGGQALTDYALQNAAGLQGQGASVTQRALGSASQLAGLEAQQGPSAAQAQLQSGLNQANQNALSLARSGRGWGGSASALSQASAQQAMNSQNAVNASAQLAAQENAAWRQRQAQNMAQAGNLALQGGQAGASIYGQGASMGATGIESGTNLGMSGTQGYLGAGFQGNAQAGQLYSEGYQGNLAAQQMGTDVWKTQSAIDLAKEQDWLQRYGINKGVPVQDEGNPLLAAGLGIGGAVIGGYFGGPGGAAAGGSLGYGIGNNL